MSVMPQPDWNRIRDIARRAEEIQRSGKMDRETWRELLSEAFLAARERPDLTSFLSTYAESAWIQELRKEELKPLRVG